MVAASLSLVLGLGFGIPCLGGLRHFARTGEVWTFMGAEVVVGVLLLADVAWAPALSHVLLPFELAFWIGFALPFGPPLGMARTALLLLA